MKNILFNLRILAISFCSYSCVSETQNIETNTIKIRNIDIDKLLPVDIDTLDNYQVSITPLEYDGKHLIGDNLKIIKADDYFVTLDKNKKLLFLFDSTGKFILQFGLNGQGPGEYSTITDFFVNNNQKEVVVFDNQYSKLIYFKYPSGILVKETKTSGIYASYVDFGDNSIHYGGSINDDSKGQAWDLVIHSNTNNKNTYLNRTSKDAKLFADFELPRFIKSPTQTYYLEPFNDEIRTIQGAKLKPIYNIGFKERNGKPFDIHKKIYPNSYKIPNSIFYDNLETCQKFNYPFIQSFAEDGTNLFIVYEYNRQSHLYTCNSNSLQTLFHTSFMYYKNIPLGLLTEWSGQSFYTIIMPEYLDECFKADNEFTKNKLPLLKRETTPKIAQAIKKFEKNWQETKPLQKLSSNTNPIIFELKTR